MLNALALIAAIRAALFVPDPLPPLQARVHSQFRPDPTVAAERVTYQTAYGLRVPAIVYRPQNPPAKKLPALIVVNGHGGDKYAWYAFYSGIAYARLGMVVLTYDPIGEGERNNLRKSGARAHDKVQEPKEAMSRRMGGLMMTDVMQAVSYLAARPDVDPKRIAAAGYSMGSFVLGLACAAETRLAACVLAGGGNLDGPGGHWDGSKVMCQGGPYKALGFLGDRPAVLYALHAERGATLVINGRRDTVVNMPKTQEAFFEDLGRRVAGLTGKPHFEYLFEDDTSHRPYFVTKPAAEWLHRRLALPGWRASLPTTHIGEWAAANGVLMDKLYATEEREGGTAAIGTGVPSLGREALSVFSAGEWGSAKLNYVYEVWVDRARGGN